jgi:hypothetical protein
MELKRANNTEGKKHCQDSARQVLISLRSARYVVSDFYFCL